MDTLQDLAQVVIDICPSGYSQARLNAELDEGYAEIDLRCINDLGEEFRSPLEGISRLDLHDKLDNVREEMAKQSGSKWKKCQFVIQPDGRFKLEVEF